MILSTIAFIAGTCVFSYVANSLTERFATSAAVAKASAVVQNVAIYGGLAAAGILGGFAGATMALYIIAGFTTLVTVFANVVAVATAPTTKCKMYALASIVLTPVHLVFAPYTLTYFNVKIAQEAMGLSDISFDLSEDAQAQAQAI